MTRISRAAFIAAALSLTAPPAQAQPAEAEVAPAPARAGDEAPDSAPAPAMPEASRKDTGADRPPSPFDYEASEEISEDLSVSFPVDI